MFKIKQKDTIILTITDQNKHLLQLNKDKNLEERERLAERVRDMEQRLLDKDNDMKMLARRLQLETKSFKTNLNIEQQKYRDLLSKLEAAHFELNRTEMSEKRGNRRGKSPSNKIKGCKSATSITYDNGDSNNNENSLTPVLPPFFDNFDTLKKPEESLKVNSKVKLFQHDKVTDDDELEVDLTRNKVDKSDKALINGNGSVESTDDITSVIKNSMNRARHHHHQHHHHYQQQSSTKPSNIPKPSTKLSPMHQQQQQIGSTCKKTTSSDDSEFSDEDYHLFNDHSNTAQQLMDNDKMVMLEPVAYKKIFRLIDLITY